MSPFYVMLVGLPGSGKTTFANRVLDDAKSLDRQTIVISTDNLLEGAGLYDPTNSLLMDWATTSMSKLLDLALDLDMNIVHDQTNLTRAKRIRMLSLIPSHYYKICVVVTGNYGSTKSIPADIFSMMEASYRTPTDDEGWDEIHFHIEASSTSNTN